MGALTLASVVLVCILGGVVFGMALRFFLPGHHVSADSTDAVKLGTGTIATLTALVLGLLISSAKGTFDTMTSELRQTGSKIIRLDRVMAQYGPDTRDIRDLLRRSLASTIDRVWPGEAGKLALSQGRASENEIELLEERLQRLSPRNDGQRWLQGQALQLSAEIASARWLLLEQVGQSSLPAPFLVVLVSWLAIIFAGFGLFSPRNGTVITALVICALSVAGAVFLILELDQPYEGVIKISSAPLRTALAYLGR